MFSLYHFVPGGTNVFIVTLCALRPKRLETCDPSGVRYGDFGGNLCRLAITNVFNCTIVRLAITNVFIVTLCALRNKMLETCDPEGVRCGILGEICAPCDNKCFHCNILSLAEQMFSL